MPWRDSDRGTSDTYDQRYRHNRREALRLAHWRCQLRLEGCIGSATQCDHITPVSQGGTHEITNLRAVCTPCHKKKTATEGGGFRARQQREDPAPRPSTTWGST